MNKVEKMLEGVIDATFMQKGFKPQRHVEAIMAMLRANGLMIVPSELSDDDCDAALRGTAVWLHIQGSQLTQNRGKMRARYRALLNHFSALSSVEEQPPVER